MVRAGPPFPHPDDEHPMQKPKLDLDDLVVSAFATSPELDISSTTLLPNPNEPTPGTGCYVCPVGTGDCY